MFTKNIFDLFTCHVTNKQTNKKSNNHEHANVLFKC